ncbi:MAG TPA: LPXTG cell wall anchor domain-containing protein [Aliicoccus persicus]|uniref:LPXTG cell wall anchor domain-containing protein n=1 Tax=Aliicoccus persicus TaxID=930138 RepID=A0A921DVE9_9STAP|nr:LPXTG cell wall anchor domain-containing protein [Aliicoccus persicus]
MRMDVGSWIALGVALAVALGAFGLFKRKKR